MTRACVCLTDRPIPSVIVLGKPYRYRWNEATHDEVLARLLDLNQKRYEQEILGGTGSKAKSAKGKSRKSAPSTIPGLEA